jgi:hypothetical protein
VNAFRHDAPFRAIVARAMGRAAIEQASAPSSAKAKK